MSGENALPDSTMIRNIFRLWRAISPVRRAQFPFIVLMMLVASLLEVVSIGAVIPFLGALLTPERIYVMPILSPVWDFLGIADARGIIVPMVWMFCIVALVAAIGRAGQVFFLNKYAFGIAHEISARIFRFTLRQPYLVHVAKNSADTINDVGNKANIVTFNIVLPSLNLISSTLVAIFISIGLFTFNILVACLSILIFGLMYAGVALYIRQRLQQFSQLTTRESATILRIINESLGAIRDVILEHGYSVYESTFNKHDSRLKSAYANHTFITSCPRPLFEAVGMILIAVIGLIFLKDGSVERAIPVLGAFAIAAQRLLPALQQIFVSYSSINAGRTALDDVINSIENCNFAIDTSAKACSVLQFTQSIELNNLSYSYPGSPRYVIKDANAKIDIGDRVGIIGPTGTGKSTLVDLIIGLLQPDEGEVLIDGQQLTAINVRGWQQNLAHVPQSIFLIDGNLAENIALGVKSDEIDKDMMSRALEISQLSHFLNGGIETENVGERGAKLSGGERQRIGIARALYKNAKIIIFDEATSALDTATERRLIEKIYDLNKSVTIIMIAHRLSTLENCNKILRIQPDGTVSQGTFGEYCA